MTDDLGQPLKLIYLTTPDKDRAVLNVQARDTEAFWRFALTREDMYRLNAQIADALMRGVGR